MAVGERAADMQVSKHLTNFAVGYAEKTLDKSVEQCVTAVPVEGTGSKFDYGEWDKGSAFEDPGMVESSPGTAPETFETNYEDAIGKIKTFKKKIKVPRDQANEYPGGATAYKETKTQQLIDHMFRGRRIRVKNMMITATNSSTPSAKFDITTTGGVFFDRIKYAKNQVYTGCGQVPNKLLVPWHVKEGIVNSKEYVDRYSGWSDTVKNSKLPDEIEELEPVILKGLYNTAAKNKTASLANIFGDRLWIAYINPAPDPYGITAMATFRNTGYQEYIVEEYWDEDTETWSVRVKMREGNVVVCNACMYMFENVLTV